MHSYMHHMGDFNTETLHLSRLERDVYRDMRDMYYANEGALDGSDMTRLAKRLRCRTDEEVAAMQFVLEEFFEQHDGGQFVHHKIERELISMRAVQTESAAVKSNENARQRKSRARRAAIFSALRAVGVVMPALSTMRQLYAACAEHGVPMPADEAVTAHVTAGPVTCHGHGTGNQSHNPKPSIPPNPPSGGAGAERDASQQHPQPEHPVDQRGGGRDPMAVATALCAFFPERRRTRVAHVAAKLQQLFADGAVSSKTLLDAASKQSARHAEEGGRSCPSVLRWLRDERWLDSAADAGAAGPVPPNWRDTRSGIEAMGKRVGMPPFDESGYRLMAAYEAEVDRRLQSEGVPA